MSKQVEFLGQELNEMIIFLIETDPDIHYQIVHALDFASMQIANRGSMLATSVYRKTKKDVFERERIPPYEALIDEKVIEFAVEYHPLLFQEFDGKAEILQKYLRICVRVLEEIRRRKN